MKRDEALCLVDKHIENDNLKKHLFAVEAVMRRFAGYFGGDEEKWALTGLLHDIDWEKTKDNPSEHTLMAERILTEAGVDPEIVKAVKVHNWNHGIPPQTIMEKVLFYVEELTGLITAAALVRPDKKIALVSTDSVLKRLKEKSFARGVNRDVIAKAPEALKLSLEKIVQIALEAMQEIALELGL